MSTVETKQIALDFLRFARAGDRAAVDRLLAPGARHHNPYFPAGMPALLDAIAAAARTAPGREADVKRVIAEGDFVVVHSHVHHAPGASVSVVHIFRFDGARIAELWDIGQLVTADSPNTDGMF